MRFLLPIVSFATVVFGLVACTAGQGLEIEEVPTAESTGKTYGSNKSLPDTVIITETQPRTDDAQTDGGVSGNDGASNNSDPTPMGLCSDRPTLIGCDACCRTAFPAGVGQCGAPWWGEFGRCACEAPATCRSVCATSFCLGGGIPPNAACDQCLSGATVCQDRAFNATPECKKLDTCARQSGCAAKP